MFRMTRSRGSRTDKGGERKMSKSTIRILAVIGCLLIGGGVLVGLNYKRWFGKSPANTLEATKTPTKKLSVDQNAGEYVAPELPTPEATAGVAIPGWGYISLPAGETEVVVDFPNPEANVDKYYLTFELRLKESGEVLYTSGLVPPGKHIQKISLSRALDEGTHNAVIHVQPYKMDEAQTPTNNADMETELIVYKN